MAPITEGAATAPRYSRPRTLRRSFEPPEKRLARLAPPDPETGCHLWTGALNVKGYGCVYNGAKRKTMSAHRLAYELSKGSIPEGLQIDHLCRNRRCVNPDHLEAVTPKTNVMRGEGLCAENARKTHCKRGHPFDSANTRISSTGGRRCLTCCAARFKARDRARTIAAKRDKQRD